MKRFFALFFLVLIATAAMAQDKVSISGRVFDKTTGDPLIGVNVLQKGSTIGTITDLDGRFSLNADKNATVIISYIGYKAQELTAINNMELSVYLEENNVGVEEVVVIGYGSQKKSVVTAAISGVSSDEILGTTVRVDEALRGNASGIMVTSASGQPGSASQVRIRGIGTINNSNPLYVVDGIPMEDGMDYLNPNDIQSIEVLKDAASGAVYGARAANGVILVTTKKGKSGAAKVTYDYSYGMQNPWTHRDVLNADEYVMMINEGYLNAGQGLRYENENDYLYGKGYDTDWQDVIFNKNAPVVNHQLSVSGANDKVNYFFSAGYINQEGIVGGNYNQSNYERISVRANNSYTLVQAKERNWLNNIVFNTSVSYSHIKSNGIDVNTQYGSPLTSALYNPPILPVYSNDPEGDAEKYKGYNLAKDDNGNQYSVIDGYQEMYNPLAMLSKPAGENITDKLVSSLSGEIQIWDNLKFRSSFGTDMYFQNSQGININFYLNNMNNSKSNSAWSNFAKGLTWILENTISYDKIIGEDHSFSILLGQSAQKTTGRNLGGTSKFLLSEDPDRPNMDFTTGSSANPDERNAWGSAYPAHTISSLFARVSYDYKARYMFQATVRRDGSSRFGSNNHYAIFPSFSLGWNITEESFLENRPSWWNTTKIRYSWGKNGNENIGDFKYTVGSAAGNNYIFGAGDAAMLTAGVKASGLANPDLKWEESVQSNIGIDFTFLKSAATFSVDWYEKKTEGMLQEMPIPSYVGETKPWGNVGKMKNSGWEFDASYRWKVGSDWNFKATVNASYLKNELINYGNETGEKELDNMGAGGAGTITKAQNGQPYPFFFGYKTAGVFQTVEEAQASGLKYKDQTPTAGDFIFVDIDGNNIIDDFDRVYIGKGMPDWTLGGTFNVDYKNFDFSMTWQGTVGNDIFDATRRIDIQDVNLPAYILDRWTGEGTTNSSPRFMVGSSYNYLSSDYYVKDGSFMRLRNIEFGYTIPKRYTKRVFIERARIYASAQNLLTFTKYEGFDPEISSGSNFNAIGVDRGVYPQSRVITFGLNVNF